MDKKNKRVLRRNVTNTTRFTANRVVGSAYERLLLLLLWCRCRCCCCCCWLLLPAAVGVVVRAGRVRRGRVPLDAFSPVLPPYTRSRNVRRFVGCREPRYMRAVGVREIIAGRIAWVRALPVRAWTAPRIRSARKTVVSCVRFRWQRHSVSQPELRNVSATSRLERKKNTDSNEQTQLKRKTNNGHRPVGNVESNSARVETK